MSARAAGRRSPREGQEDWVEGCSGKRAAGKVWKGGRCSGDGAKEGNRDGVGVYGSKITEREKDRPDWDLNPGLLRDRQGYLTAILSSLLMSQTPDFMYKNLAQLYRLWQSAASAADTLKYCIRMCHCESASRFGTWLASKSRNQRVQSATFTFGARADDCGLYSE